MNTILLKSIQTILKRLTIRFSLLDGPLLNLNESKLWSLKVENRIHLKAIWITSCAFFPNHSL